VTEVLLHYPLKTLYHIIIIISFVHMSQHSVTSCHQIVDMCWWFTITVAVIHQYCKKNSTAAQLDSTMPFMLDQLEKNITLTYTNNII